MTSKDGELAHKKIDGHAEKRVGLDKLCFITCGSDAVGKSTLIEHLLFEAKQISDDQSVAIRSISEADSTQGPTVDLTSFVEELGAEREQGIATDVEYRLFATSKRVFMVADVPSHEQYTRTLATSASAADLAVVFIDARHGLLPNTLSHSQVHSMMGTPHIVLAVNKMDLVDYDQEIFLEIERNYRAFVKGFDSFGTVIVIPMSASNGDNVTRSSPKLPWYKGRTLLSHLENVAITSEPTGIEFRMPMHLTSRPNSDFKGYCGRIASGTVTRGDPVRIVPSGISTIISGITAGDQQLESASSGRLVALAFDRDIDVSAGDVVTPANAPCEVSDQFETTILWIADTELLPGRRYILKCATQSVPATVTKIKFQRDMNTLAELAADQLQLNEMGVCNISTEKPIAFDPYTDNKTMGGFILIDRLTNATVGLGMIHFALRRASNIHLQATKIDRQSRSDLKQHKPAVLWFTGLSGSGKSTIADLVEQRLHKRCIHSMLLDGDNVRHGLNRDLGFTDTDRVENIRRIAEVTKLTFDAGLITLVSFISPFQDERRMARNTIGGDAFLEIHVDTPLEVAEDRDVKGLYAKARAGEIKNFTGIDSPYEPPENPEIVLDTVSMSPAEAADHVITILESRGFIGSIK